MQNSEAPTPPSPVLLLRVAVGSKNPVKINAVRQALEQVLEASSSRRQSQQEQDEQPQETRVELQIESFDVPSGVSTQPVGDVSARVFHPASILVVWFCFSFSHITGPFHLSVIRTCPKTRNKYIQHTNIQQQETRQGAINRAHSAYEAYYQQVHPPSTRKRRPDLAIGLEGGVEEWSSSYNPTNSDHDNEHTNTTTTMTINTSNTANTKTTELGCMAWMAIVGKRSNLLAECLASSDSTFYAIDTTPIVSVAKTATFLLPTAIRRLIQEQGMELGHADDVLFGRINSKQDSGTVGILTNGSIDRTHYYQPAIVLALVPWIRPDLYYVNTTTTTNTTTNTKDLSSHPTKTLETTSDMDTEKDDKDEESGTSTNTSSSFWGNLFCVKKKQ